MKEKKEIEIYQKIDKEIDKAISKFSQHLMSNSKWIKLISKLAENSEKILKIEFKKVHTDKTGELYIDTKTSYEFDYWQNGFEGNNSFGGWLTFKEIEYLEFPKSVDIKKKLEQDLSFIEEVIKSVGEFSLESNEDRLLLNCYKI